MKKADNELTDDHVSRRAFLNSATAGAAVAALAAGGYTARSASAAPLTAKTTAGSLEHSPQAPFDSLRDWVAALDAHGLLLRFDRIDQDAFHIPALFYKATDRWSVYGSPCMMFDEIKIDGQWTRGPVIVNPQGHWNTDAIIWGLPVIPDDPFETYRSARRYLQQMLADNRGRYPQIPPVEVSRGRAPVKEVVLTGDAIDLTKFAFVKTNPADGGRYVNTGSHFMVDPELGANFGTYRCQIKGPRTLGINPEPGQTGDKFLQAAKKRGQKVMKYSIVVGHDPVIWMISGTRVAPRFDGKPQDELAIAGGMRGRAIEVVKSETTDIVVPAHAEMIIEGEVQLNGPYEDEGPFGEMFGYLGAVKKNNFLFNVTKITHRKNPWIQNALTGMQRGMVTAPMDAMYSVLFKRMIPNFVEYTNPQDTMGIVVISIDKTGPGQGLEAGLKVAGRIPIAKITIVVDKDVNVLDRRDVLFAIGSRWQPNPATEIIDEARGLFTDPSQVEYSRTSKIVIDATRQLPGEGGKKVFPETNRALLEKGAPDALTEVVKLYSRKLAGWKRL